MVEWSQTWNWFDGQWLPGNPPIMGPRTHAAWLCSSVFDGARSIAGRMPDIERHCRRLNDSATRMALAPTMSVSEIIDLCREGVSRFEADAALYIKPIYWAEGNGPTMITPDGDTTRFCLCIFHAPLAPKNHAIAITASQFRRPTADCAPLEAKAGCLYPNNARAIADAETRGFNNAIMLDAIGNVAELASANLFMVKNNVVKTPIANGTFLNGITRQRVISLLRDANETVEESILRLDDFMEADEIFSTSNFNKIMDVNRIESRRMQPGRLTRKAKELYWDHANRGEF